MELFQEAGVCAYVGFVVFCASLVAITRGKDASAPGAALIMAIALVGDGMGQRMVAKAIEGVPDLAQRVTIMAQGTKEAAANLDLGGMLAIVLLAIGLSVNAARRT